MSLEKELCLRKGFKLLEHEAVLNIYYTASKLKKRATEFFRRFGLTDVQFNVIMLLAHQSTEEGGLSQAQLSDMMLVNRANVTTLVDRMERAGLVVRTGSAGDRRRNIVKLTSKGGVLFAKVEPLYSKEVKELMATLSAAQQKRLIAILEGLRSRL